MIVLIHAFNSQAMNWGSTLSIMYDNGDFEAHLNTPGVKLGHARQANFMISGTKLQKLRGTYFPGAGWHEKHWKRE